MKQIEIEQIWPASLTKEELEMIVGAWRRLKWQDRPVEELFTRSAKDDVWFYRLKAEGLNLIVIACQQFEGLYVELVAGKGYFRNFALVHEAMKMVTHGRGLRRLGGMVLCGSGLERLYARHTKAEPEATLYMEQV